MKTFQSWFFRILWWLTFVAIVLVAIVLINRQAIVRELIERQIRTSTGMDPAIGNFTFGVLNPKLSFVNFTLYNPAEFGGTVFVQAPEVRMTYDRDALRRREIHIQFMQLNLKEIDVVKNAAGATNIMSFFNTIAPRQAAGGRTFAPLNGYKFTGIDTLNISIGTAKFVDLQDPRKNRQVAVNLENQIFTNVVSTASLQGLSEKLWYRSAYLVGLPVHPPKGGGTVMDALAPKP